ncbi:MBL fold metallo-hydrolase [Pseudohongiella spirulinae]|uniref:Metallo-beta-lactamase superfamily protein n=1 Tax=Pseudohongiella spirulinae TaxID=1249552 RepID=A0A0S2KC51_9GAMM|nr:MBL fold metallo-hydrolase [Pseudohongiella spirulinae]ALO45880.1 Metallo-beta-lactamase superfamily protein [Pseudohongiella spirulinae]
MKTATVWQDCGFGITCIDTGLFRDGLAACYLLRSGDEVALIDTGPRNSVPRILQTIADHGLTPDQVRWVMPTHVHLDHAGGAGALLAEFPNADMLVHERGARHMIEPAKLQAGSLAVYGEKRYKAAFGELVAADADRVISVVEGDEFCVGTRRLQILDTPGHARHHYVVWDAESNGLFTGDTFGVSYPELNTGRQPFIFPPTTPVQFDPQAWHASLDRLLTLPVERVFLTHFGMHEQPQSLAQQLHEQIDRYVNLARQVVAGKSRSDWSADELHPVLSAKLMQNSLDELAARRCPQPPALIRQALAGDMDLNAQGLVDWLFKSSPT